MDKFEIMQLMQKGIDLQHKSDCKLIDEVIEASKIDPIAGPIFASVLGILLDKMKRAKAVMPKNEFEEQFIRSYSK